MKDTDDLLKKQGLAFSVLAKNGYQTRAPHVNATGFRTASLHYDERAQLSNLAELFLVNSFLSRNDAEINTAISAYLMDDGVKMVSLTDQEDLSPYALTALGENLPLDCALGEAIVNRRSIRHFTGDPIHLAHLSTVIRAMSGVSAQAKSQCYDGSFAQFNLRTVPSAGGLYPIEIYIAALNCQGLAKGVYRYQPIQDVFVCQGDESCLKQVCTSFSGAVDMLRESHAGALCLYVAKPWRSMRKYGDRGLRFVFQEIGGMSQNLHLAATALGLGGVDCASFFEDDLNAALGFDGVYQVALHASLLGCTA